MGVLLIGSGTGSSTDPVEPTPLYSLGPNDYAHRWAAERLTGSDGTEVTAWPDAVGTNPVNLLVSGTTGAFNLSTESGERTVVAEPVTGINRALVAAGVGPVGAVATVAFVVRTDPGNTLAASRRFASGLGVRFEKAANHNYSMVGNGGSVYKGGVLDTWALVFFQTDGTNPIASGHLVFGVNGIEGTAVSATVTPSTAYAPLALQMNAAALAENRYAEVIWWDRALSVDERASVFAAVQGRYAFL